MVDIVLVGMFQEGCSLCNAAGGVQDWPVLL
jgi:hypothetical protein